MKERKSVVILAAGIGSRYGGGIKQFEGVGEHGELIIEYSVRDAVDVGFDNIVIVLRQSIFSDFMERCGNEMQKELKKKKIGFNCVFQETGSLPEKRKKPWGTGHALLAAVPAVDGSFVVINADDYYGKDAFKKAYAYLEGKHTESDIGVIGYRLCNTLSDNGGVTRAILEADENNIVHSIKETKNITVSFNAIVNGTDAFSPDELVSMNMWMFQNDFFKILGQKWADFRFGMYSPEIESGEWKVKYPSKKNPLTDEFLIPDIVGELIRDGIGKVTVIPTDDKWCGLTFAEDLKKVKEFFKGV